ncbi:MAG: hypothetical protein LAO03_06185 [Acidobacteriia bacterium]|nr:hypothetical protein [Terriglobia bacterium]
MKKLMFFLPLLLASFAFTQNFNATPVTDFQPGQLYLGTFPGFLYEGSNSPPADHDSDGRAAAARVQPLDRQGHPSSRGKIAVVGIGFSNWTDEFCDQQNGQCYSQSLLGVAAKDPQVNHTTLVLVDCAKPGQGADRWLDDSFRNYSYCLSQLQKAGVTEAQVQVILYKDANFHPSQALTARDVCSPTSRADACMYEYFVGQTARFIKGRYPNVQQMFLHSRIYGGYAKPHTLNPEPFAYEYGFATKWLIEAQIVQLRTGLIDPTAGDLSYSAAPWIAWGPYFWASGTIPRKDGLTWVITDFSRSDFTHPDDSAIAKVSRMMLDFYLLSPYAPWFSAH